MTETSITLPARSGAARPVAAADPAETPLPRWGARAGVAAPILALFATVAGAPLYADDLSDAASTGRFTIASVATLAALDRAGACARRPVPRAAPAAARAGARRAADRLHGNRARRGRRLGLPVHRALPRRGGARRAGPDTTGSLLAGFVISYLVLVVGWVLFAVATLRARVLPRAGTIVMLVGAILAFLPAPTRCASSRSRSASRCARAGVLRAPGER